MDKIISSPRISQSIPEIEQENISDVKAKTLRAQPELSNPLSSPSRSNYLIQALNQSKLLTNTLSVFSENDRPKVRACIETFLNPSDLLKATDQSAIEQGMCWGCPCELDIDLITPFVDNLIACGVLHKDGHGQLFAPEISPKFYNFLLKTLETEKVITG